MYRRILLTVPMLTVFPAVSYPAPVITCHCFTERSYNPMKPAAADQYLLATTQNSLIAALFSVDKKSIVMKKQAGSSADDLWIAHWMAAKSGMVAEDLLAAKEKAESWKGVVMPIKGAANLFGTSFTAEVAGGAESGMLARAIIDETLVSCKLLGRQELLNLRREQAGDQEVIIAALIAAKSSRQPVQIYRDVKKGMKSWGTLLNEAKIQASGIQGEFALLIKSK